MTMRLIGEGVGKCQTHGATLVTDEQVDVCDLISFAAEGFSNVHQHE